MPAPQKKPKPRTAVNKSGGIPFIDLGGKYVISASVCTSAGVTAAATKLGP